MCRRVVKTPEQPVSGNSGGSYHIELAYRAGPTNINQPEHEITPASTYGGTMVGDSNPATPEELAHDAEIIRSQRAKYIKECHGVNVVQNSQLSSISSDSERLGQPHSDEGNVFLDTPVNRSEAVTSTLAPRADRAGMQITADNAQAVLSPEACVFVASLAATRTDEQLARSVYSVFSVFGEVWVKIRRDNNGMPYAFAQYEHVANALRAVEEGRGAIIDGRPCRTERAKVNRGVYLSNIRGGRVSENEARQLLEVYGAIEKIWYATPTELEIYRLPMGIWVKFAFFDDCRDAEQGLRDSATYRLDQPGKVKAGSSRSQLRVSPQHESAPAQARPRRNDGASIYVGGLPTAVTHDQLCQMFACCGTIVGLEILLRPLSDRVGRAVFAYIEFSRRDEATRAIAKGTFFHGVRLTVERKETPTIQGHRPASTGATSAQITEEGREVYMQRALAMGISPSHIAAIFDPSAVGHALSAPSYCYNPWYPPYYPTQYGAYAPGIPNGNHDAVGNNGSYGPAPYFPYNATYPSMSGFTYPPMEPNFAATTLAELP